MGLIHTPFDREDWLRGVSTQTKINKLKNVFWIDKLTEIIDTIDVDGQIFYKDNRSPVPNDSAFYYNYGSPVPNLCKVLPYGYGFTFFVPNHFYRDVSPIKDIQTKLKILHEKGVMTRYTQPKVTPKILPQNYVLVVMQDTSYFSEISKDIATWAKENKKNVVFKWHNGCTDYLSPQKWFDQLEPKSQYLFFDHESSLTPLIQECDMVWTYNSMVGVESLIHNKPVAVYEECEYMEMTKFIDNPDDAYTTAIPNDLDQWLTYYFKIYCIDILCDNARDRLRTRMIKHLEGRSLREIIFS
jgi:hypothetical protein